MPPQQSSNQAQQAQQALTVLLAEAVARLWPMIDLHDLKVSLPRFETSLAAVVFKFGQASASVAARSYQEQRAAAGVPGRYLPTPVDPPPVEKVTATLGWATRGLWTADPDVEAVRTVTVGAAQKLVTDTGRGTVAAAIEQDRRCRGWAREAQGGACAFCAMLSTRGAVYRTKITGGFRAHDMCHCLPVPLFTDRYTPPAHVQQWRRLWRDSTKGRTGKAAQLAFRQALEHRSPRSVPAVDIPSAPRRDAQHLTPALERSLRAMERANSGGELDAAITALRGRLAALQPAA